MRAWQNQLQNEIPEQPLMTAATVTVMACYRGCGAAGGFNETEKNVELQLQ